MDVFEMRDAAVAEYRDFIKGFLHVRDALARERIETALDSGLLWPAPWLSLNARFEYGGLIHELVAARDAEGPLRPGRLRVALR